MESLSILLKAVRIPGAKLRADLRVGILPTLCSFTISAYLLLFLRSEKPQCTKEDSADFEAVKLFSRPNCLLKYPVYFGHQTSTVLQRQLHKAAQSPTDCQKESDDNNRYFLLCLLQPMKTPLILTKIKHKTRINKELILNLG